MFSSCGSCASDPSITTRPEIDSEGSSGSAIPEMSSPATTMCVSPHSPVWAGAAPVLTSRGNARAISVYWPGGTPLNTKRPSSDKLLLRLPMTAPLFTSCTMARIPSGAVVDPSTLAVAT